MALIGAIGLCVSAMILEMYRLFPTSTHSTTSLVGGFAGADGKFYIDVWRSADGEALVDESRASTGKDKVRVHSSTLINLGIHPGIDS